MKWKSDILPECINKNFSAPFWEKMEKDRHCESCRERETNKLMERVKDTGKKKIEASSAVMLFCELWKWERELILCVDIKVLVRLSTAHSPCAHTHINSRGRIPSFAVKDSSCFMRTKQNKRHHERKATDGAIEKYMQC